MHSLLLCDAYAYRELQKTTENIYVSNGLWRIVTFLIIVPYKYS